MSDYGEIKMNEFDIIKLVEATIIKANSHFKLSLDIPKVTFFLKKVYMQVLLGTQSIK